MDNIESIEPKIKDIAKQYGCRVFFDFDIIEFKYRVLLERSSISTRIAVSIPDITCAKPTEGYILSKVTEACKLLVKVTE